MGDLGGDALMARAMMLIPLLLSLSVHEFAHAWTALYLGDDTAERMQRVTLNPLAHIDPVGTLLLPLLGIPFGWAKPVPFQALRFREGVNLRLGSMLVAAAGPISNVILAAVCLAVIKVFHLQGTNDAIHELLKMLVTVNLSLALFNLIPVPPLDGSWIVDALLPYRFQPFWSKYVRSTAGGVALLMIGLSCSGYYLRSLLSSIERSLGGF